MSNTTSRLSLVEPVTTDAPSVLRTAIATNATALDGAVIESSGTIAGRSSASLYGGLGQFYYATDAGVPFVSYNSTWNAIDLTPVSTAVSVSAVDGQAVVVTGSGAVTITLPSHQLGNTVAVTNYSTGGTTVSGTSIYGVGLSAASSFALGTIGAAVLLIDDGSNWRIVSGQQDTGWVALPLNTGWIAATGGYITPSYRLLGDRVWLKGALYNNAAGANNFFPLNTLPAAIRPSSNSVNVSINSVNANTSNVLQIASTGSVALAAGVAQTGSLAYLGLDGASYTLS